MNLDDIFLKSYINEFSEREQKKASHSIEDRKIAEIKYKKLAIIEEFLQKFVDIGLLVTHKDQFSKNTIGIEDINAQPFEFYQADSSKSWAPGISILFDHPCEVEIAIPNKAEQGVVIIKVASHHPYAYILEQKFNNFENACEALARFLSKCTVRITKDPSTIIKQNKPTVKTNKNPQELFNNLPDAPPKSKKTESKDGVSLSKINELFYTKNKEE